MQKLIKISLTDCIGSLVPILCWYLIGMLFDNRFTEGFILTYFYQFICDMLDRVLVISNVKCEHKYQERNHSHSLTGMFLGSVLILTISLCLSLNNWIYGFYDIAKTEYMPIMLFGSLMFVLDFYVYALKIILQYDDKHKEAAMVVYGYYIGKLLIIVLASLLCTDVWTFVVVSLSGCCMLVILLLFAHRYLFAGFDFKLRIIEPVQMSCQKIVFSLFMFVIYLFGLNTIAYSAQYLAAYNAMSMATDVQWDIQSSAIDTYATLCVIHKKWDDSVKKMMLQTAMFSFILVCSSCVILLPLCLTLHVSLKYAYLMFFIECWAFPLYGMRYAMSAWVNYTCPTFMLVLITTLCYGARMFVTFTLGSPFALSWAVCVSAIFANGLNMLWYFYKRRTCQFVAAKSMCRLSK